jgi:hypothetical protein
MRAVERVVQVPAEGTVDVRFTLERVVDLRRHGWFAGDSHVHMLHGERTLPVGFDYVALTARAEDLQYLSLAQAWTLDNPTPERLTTELRSRSTPDCTLTWNLEAPKNYYRGDAGRCLGHCWMLGVNGRTAKGEDVIDLLMRASAHDYQSEKPTYANFESHQLIHAQDGAAFYSHPARWWMGPWGGQGGYPKVERMRVSNLAVELPLDTLAGPTFDGLDLITGPGEFEANSMAFELWCLLLNHGYRLSGTASSDACFDRPGGAIPGVVRTYTYVGGEFSLPSVTRAAAQGRNFATSGPLMLVSLDGKPPGATVRADGKSHVLQLEAWASGEDPLGLTAWELLRNGRVVSSNFFTSALASFRTNLSLAEATDCWYCVRLYGGDRQRQRAISGAFFFESKGHHSPAPVPARVQVALQDASTGEAIKGVVTEMRYLGPVPVEGARHTVSMGGRALTVPATVRLRAEAKGYQAATRSPFLDYRPLLELITGLSAEDLLKWETFERVRALMEQTTLTFRMRKNSR